MTGRLLPATPSPSPNACGGFIRGALRWVITRTTPGAASAAAVSSAGDAAARDRRMHDGGVEHPLHRDLGGEARLAAHLQRAVEPRHRRADMAVLAVSRRRRALRPRAGHQGIGHMAQHRAQDPGHAHARAPVGCELAEDRDDRALRQLDLERVVAQTAGPRRARPRRRDGTASSAALAAQERLRPRSARHGLCATPPSASRTSRDRAVRRPRAPPRPRPARRRSSPGRAPCDRSSAARAAAAAARPR